MSPLTRLAVALVLAVALPPSRTEAEAQAPALPARAPQAAPARVPQAPPADVAPRLDVPYVPTPQAVVDEMLQLAKPTKADLLYDLGCGDGRIVVTAAKQFGTKGVGFDIDPARIRDSEANAQSAEVSGLASFRRQDLFTVSLAEPSVLTMYLLPSVNMKLRPKILAEMKPGTRVVSHAFTMEDWLPDQRSSVNGATSSSGSCPRTSAVPGRSPASRAVRRRCASSSSSRRRRAPSSRRPGPSRRCATSW